MNNGEIERMLRQAQPINLQSPPQMLRAERIVYLAHSLRVGPASVVAPDLGLRDGSGNDPTCICFSIREDGAERTYVFACSDEQMQSQHLLYDPPEQDLFDGEDR